MISASLLCHGRELLIELGAAWTGRLTKSSHLESNAVYLENFPYLLSSAQKRTEEGQHLG